MIWFDNPLRFSVQSEIMSLNAIYPVSLAQNVITTGLITLKIWNQHRNSTASGVIDRSSRLSLLKIVRIIIESAMIYTGQLFILVILYFANNTFQYVVQNAIVPSLGKHGIRNIFDSLAQLFPFQVLSSCSSLYGFTTPSSSMPK
jgi:hypothetical protein